MGYAGIMILLGLWFNRLAYAWTEEENWQYQKQFTDKMIQRLFQFNILNFYFPFIIVAFDQKNERNFVDLFYLLLTQMAIKQLFFNYVEYQIPRFMAKDKLEEHNERYHDILEKYKEFSQRDASKNVNEDLTKSIRTHHSHRVVQD